MNIYKHMTTKELGCARKPRLLFNEVVTTRNVSTYLSQVATTNGERPIAAALVHRDVVDRLEKDTMSTFVATGWNGDELRIAASVSKKAAAASDIFPLLKAQMAQRTAAMVPEGYSIRVLPRSSQKNDFVIRQIAKIEKDVFCVSDVALTTIRKAVEKHIVAVATIRGQLAGYVYTSIHVGLFPEDVTLFDMKQPRILPSEPIELRLALIRNSLDTIHCFHPTRNLVAMSDLGFDISLNAQMAAAGFMPSFPVEREDGAHLLWVCDSANDFSKRSDVGGETQEKTSENVKALFNGNPGLSVDDFLSGFRAAGLDRERTIALKAVASRADGRKIDSSPDAGSAASDQKKRGTLRSADEIKDVFRENPHMSVAQLQSLYRIPEEFTVKDGNPTPYILAGFKAAVSSEIKAGRKPTPAKKVVAEKAQRQSGRKIRTLDEAREVFARFPDMTVPRMLDEYDVNRALTTNEEGSFTTQKLAGIKAALTKAGQILAV